MTSTELMAQQEVTLLDLVDRLLSGGVVLVGDVTLSVADVDLIHVGLQLLIRSVEESAEAAQ